MGHTPVRKNEVENEIICNDKFVTIAGRSVFYRSWYEAGVKYIKDLIAEDGNLMTLTVLQHTFGIKTGKRNLRIATRRMILTTAKIRLMIYLIYFK